MGLEADFSGRTVVVTGATRGGPAQYSGMTIEIRLALRFVFGLPLRQTQGALVKSSGYNQRSRIEA
jgi:hypothetical protein